MVLFHFRGSNGYRNEVPQMGFECICGYLKVLRVLRVLMVLRVLRVSMLFEGIEGFDG